MEWNRKRLVNYMGSLVNEDYVTELQETRRSSYGKCYREVKNGKSN